MNLQDYIRDIQDFPKEGIGFKDITPLLISPEATNFCLEKLVKSLENFERTIISKNITKEILKHNGHHFFSTNF